MKHLTRVYASLFIYLICVSFTGPLNNVTTEWVIMNSIKFIISLVLGISYRINNLSHSIKKMCYNRSSYMQYWIHSIEHPISYCHMVYKLLCGYSEESIADNVGFYLHQIVPVAEWIDEWTFGFMKCDIRLTNIITQKKIDCSWNSNSSKVGAFTSFLTTSASVW